MAERLDDRQDQLFRVNNNLCEFSPNGEFLAIAYQTNLLVKRSSSFETKDVHELDEIVEYIEWSPDSQFVIGANLKNYVIRVFSINSPKWKCKLVEGSAGLSKVTWTPDSSHIISFADFNIQISIWSLHSCEKVTGIKNLKSLSKNIEFSPNGKNLAVIVTNDGEDYIEIYKTEGWRISRKLLCSPLPSIDGLLWSPRSDLLSIWCAVSGKSEMLVYSTIHDKDVGAFRPELSIDNRNSYAASGIGKVLWDPSGELLAIAAFNETIVMVNYLTWSPIVGLRCDPVIKDNDYLGKVFKEFTDDKDSVHPGQSKKHYVTEVMERPINVPIANDFPRNSEPSIAEVDIFEISPSSHILALRHQLYPSTLWIWDYLDNTVDHLLLKWPISGISWSPNSPRLMIFTERALIFEWRIDRGVVCHPSPRGITVISGQWHPSGKMLLLYGYNKTAIMRVTE